MKKQPIQNNIHPTIFEEKEVRRIWNDEQWYFAINDVVEVLTQTSNVSDYIKKMRLRDTELGKGWGQIVTPLSIPTKGGLQKLNCAKGYNDDWIAKRMRGINIRNTLTDQWQERGAQEKFDFAILTNEIYKGTFEYD